MIVLGLGNDLCNIERIQNSLDRFGYRFIKRIFAETEIARAERRPLTRTATFAKRFAAKEACAKALGTGLRHGVYWRDMVVTNLPSGQPTLQLSGGAAVQLNRITPAGMKAHINLTLTDDHPWAQAIVLITAQNIAEITPDSFNLRPQA